MPTIAEAQRRAGSKAFEGLGTGRSSVRLSTLESMLALYAEQFIREAQDNLVKANSVSTGDLSSSLVFKIKYMGSTYKLSLLAADYYDYVNKGVKGVNGTGTSPYKFKHIRPSKSHVEAVSKWIREGRSKVKVTDVRYGKTKQETKAIPYEKKLKTLSYIIARSSKIKGIKGTGFWDDAFNDTFKDFAIEMGRALGVDVNVDLKQLAQGVRK